MNLLEQLPLITAPGSESASSDATEAAAFAGGREAREFVLRDLALRDLMASRSYYLVDVRSPAEFTEDHIPEARSVPLFSDQERAVVGTLYRHAGPGAARAWGEDRVVARLAGYFAEMCEAFDLDATGQPRANPTWPRVIACARGGQRSQAVADWLQGRGVAVRRLVGGYRSYRATVRNELRRVRIPRPIVLHGLTGVGKTHVLRAVAAALPGQVLDLEALAGHRSSLLGDIGLIPASQKLFESRLARAIANLTGPFTLCEWEGRRIGDRELPLEVYQQLQRATHVCLEARIDQRVDLLCREYLSVGGVEEVTQRLAGLERCETLGIQGVSEVVALLRAGEISSAVRRLLVEHYDPRYLHSQQHLSCARRFALTTIPDTARAIVEWSEEHVR
ncbi:MAG: tRNA 2-selenouridine(34) synthase MnmH [Planctomycetota bacterium]